MAFKAAYDLQLLEGREFTFVAADNPHHKVRLDITSVEDNGTEVNITGNSIGSSFTGIKAAKRDETPVRVVGQFKREGDELLGDLSNA